MKNIFKLMAFICAFSIIIIGAEFNIKNVYAYETDDILVEINLEGGNNGEFKAGEDVSIKFKVNNVKSLYAASFKYTYDPNILQVDSIDVGKDISSGSIYEAYKDTNKDGNIARYCFTFLGDAEGLDGNYDFATIKGKAKADGKIVFNKDNIQFELIKRVGNDMIKNDYYLDDVDNNVYKVTNVKTEEGKPTNEVRTELVRTSADNIVNNTINNSTNISNNGDNIVDNNKEDVMDLEDDNFSEVEENLNSDDYEEKTKDVSNKREGATSVNTSDRSIKALIISIIAVVIGRIMEAYLMKIREGKGQES